MADRKETKVSGLVGMIRCQPRDASAKKMIPLYEELAAALPDNQDVACDLAYLRLLARDDVGASAARAEELFLALPNALTRLSTAALARLRMGDPEGALELYRGKEIDWKGASGPVARRPPLRRPEVESPSGRGRKSGKGIDPSRLRPEERELMGVGQVRQARTVANADPGDDACINGGFPLRRGCHGRIVTCTIPRACDHPLPLPR